MAPLAGYPIAPFGHRVPFLRRGLAPFVRAVAYQLCVFTLSGGGLACVGGGLAAPLRVGVFLGQSVALIPGVSSALALVGRSVALIGLAIAMVGSGIALFRCVTAFVSCGVALVRRGVTIIGCRFAPANGCAALNASHFAPLGRTVTLLSRRVAIVGGPVTFLGGETSLIDCHTLSRLTAPL